MKLAFVEMCGFRGFKEKARFDLPGGFAVLTGRNGVGKSTVLDAIEFVLVGSINKYDVKSAKGGGLKEHIWWVGEGHAVEHYVRVGLVDETGQQFVVTHDRDAGLDVPAAEIARRLCLPGVTASVEPDTLMQTTLIRDEKIAGLSLDLPERERAIAVRAAIGGLIGRDHSKRTQGLLVATEKAAKTAEERLANAQAELGRALGQLTEARSAAEKQADVAEAERVIADLVPDVAVIVATERPELLRRRIAEWKRSIAALSEAIKRAESIKDERAFFDSEAGTAQHAAARAACTAAREAKAQADQLLLSAETAETREREADAFVAHMVALVEHGDAVGLQDGHCPLCNAKRTSEEFRSAVEAARTRLAERGARVRDAAAAVERARAAARQAGTASAETEKRLGDFDQRRKRLYEETQAIERTFAEWKFDASVSDSGLARERLLERQEQASRLEQAVFTLEASSAHDRVTALEKRVEERRMHRDDEAAKWSATEHALELARQIHKSAQAVANEMVEEQFDTVMPLLKELYRRLRPHTDWREIETDFGGKVRASLNFTVGDGHNPQFLFSSGQRRAAGLSFLLAIHLSRPWCRFRSLLLDDPVQHIDDYRALNLVEVLSAVRRTGRQVIVAVEDTALADVLCRRLRSTAVDVGRRFDLGTAKTGSAFIEHQTDIYPLPREVLQAQA